MIEQRANKEKIDRSGEDRTKDEQKETRFNCEGTVRMKRKKSSEERRREAINRRILEDEGFTPKEIAQLPGRVRRTILEKYKS